MNYHLRNAALSAMLLTSPVAVALAQATLSQATSVAGPGTPASTRAAEQQATAYAQRLTTELGLAPAQQTQVRQIILASRLEMAAATKASHEGGDPAAVRPAMKAARDKADAALRGVLTPAQFAKYQQYVAARIGQLRTTSQTN